jgi:hypothetical protein
MFAKKTRNYDIALQRNGAANESQNAKRKTQSRVCSAGEPQRKIKRQRAKVKDRTFKNPC